MSHYKADLFALTETWLTADDTAAKLEIIPSGYKLMNHHHIGHRGGSFTLLYKETVSVSIIKYSDNKSFPSFEFFELQVKFGSLAARLVIVYCPPCTKSLFSKFTSYLESIILSTEPILIVGDFNLHVDAEGDAAAGDFLDILESMGLEQHVTGPTHNLGHTLDLIITCQFDSIIKNGPTIGQFFSDHAAVLCDLNSIKPGASVKNVTYRNFKSVNIESFKSDLAKSALCNENIANLSLDDLVTSYDSSLSLLIESHAPLKGRTVVNRPCVPWFNDSIKVAMSER